MDDLISEFITETSESLATLDSELVKLEQNPNDQTILGNIFRLVHTIKGTCGFLGLPRLESVAHAGENVLGKIRDGEIAVDPAAISIVLESLDCIKGLVEHLAENGSEATGDDSDLIARLNAFAQGASVATAAPASAPAALLPEAKTEEMFAPDESKKSGGITQAELDALEAAFNSTSSTVDGGVDFTKAPAVDALPAIATAAATLPPAKTALTPQAKETAVKQGLDADIKEPGAATAANQTIRVNLDVLENLMQMVSELVLTRNQLLQLVRNREDLELKTPLQQLSQITTELQDSVMKTRMQPIGNAWSKFPRLVRDLSNELHKKIELRMSGEATELDRQLLEMIKDPLTHMVRNSCDHGLETPSERTAAGKSEVGAVSLSAYHEGGHIVIEIADDGRGLNLDKIKTKIIEKKLATADELAQQSDEQIMQYIFKPGFSTAEKVTSVSGRGVGMDVVRTNIEKIGGTVSLSSTYGKGSTFHIKIPLTLAIVSVLLIEAAGQQFAIPQINVVELVGVGGNSEYAIETISNASVLRLRDSLLPLMRLSDMLGLPHQHNADSEYVAVIRVGSSDMGLIIDKVYDTEEIVVKPVNRVLGDLDIYSGNTILGDGSVVMILDPGGVARRFGDRDTGKAAVDVPAAMGTSTDRNASFLVFTAGEGAPKAVPLELVSRLEVIEASTVEHSGHDPVVQYRGDLMLLKTLPGTSIPQQGAFDVIVFTYDGRTIGLAVDAIIDILMAPQTIKLAAAESQYIGSNVINGKTTDIVDVGYLLKDFAATISAAQPIDDAVRGKRLLLVEDSMFFMQLLAPFLRQSGYEVMEAQSAPAALALLAESPPIDLIITDIEMPVMDGFDFVAQLARDPHYRHTPVIAFTSTVNEAIKMQAERSTIQAVILKTDRALLLETVAQCLTPQEEMA